MRHAHALAVCLAVIGAAPLAAQQPTEPTKPSKTEEGLGLVDRGVRLLFEGLMQQMEPALDDLKGLSDDLRPRFEALLAEMGPALTDLLNKVDDFRNYEAPEILENGDILIRRKPDAPPYVAPEPSPPIEL